MRAFIAIEISDRGVLDSIKKIQSKIKIQAKPVVPENIHFTLLFLGEVSESELKKITEAISSVEFSSFSVIFQGIGAFPKPRFPRVVWLGTDELGGENLREMAKKVEEALSPLGFHSDKPFQPHITIFRIKNRIGDISKDLAEFEGVNFGSQKISEIKLKKSDLTPTGPIYSDLKVVRAKS